MKKFEICHCTGSIIAQTTLTMLSSQKPAAETRKVFLFGHLSKTNKTASSANSHFACRAVRIPRKLEQGDAKTVGKDDRIWSYLDEVRVVCFCIR